MTALNSLKQMIKFGSDFSGIGAPEAALKRLNLPVKNVFACEIDKYAKNSFLELNNPITFYEDITTRNHKEVPNLDLYVAGFPCQSFSLAGKRGGFEDTRGTLFFNVAEFIKENQPKCFVLENVKGLLSHDSGKTFQTITDILTNGGGTLNGQIAFNTIDNGLGYHVYTNVLNTKDYGIPQNRERIFIVGFKYWREFRFPKKMELKLKLKDILQDNPNSKYIVSKIGVDLLINTQKFNKFKTLNNDSEFVDCITARCNKVSNDNNFIEVDEKYYLSEKKILSFSNYKEIHKENSILIHSLHPRTGDPLKGGTGHLSKSDGTTYCLDTSNSQAIEINEIKRLEDLKLIIEKRVNDTPITINQFLKDNKKGTIRQIADSIDLPKTKVEHYFRIDKSRAIPNAVDWFKLKDLLGFSDKYDKEVTEISKQISSFESSSRLYSDEGIGPTLQTGEQGYYQTNKRIRRLTPLECWRLQGFTDKEFFKAQKVNSDTQLYKQAGNTITVNVLVELFKKIYLK